MTEPDHTEELLHNYLAEVSFLNDAAPIGDDDPLWDSVSKVEKAVLEATLRRRS